MSPNKKIALAMLSLFIVWVTIACSCGSLIPIGNDSNTQEAEKEVEVPTERESTRESTPPFIDHFTNEITILAGDRGTVVAGCPSGSLLLSGGFVTGEGMIITKTMPDVTGWVVTGRNDSGGSLQLTVIAYCLQNAPGSVKVESDEVLVSGVPRVSCATGDLLTGGGYAFESETLEVYISTPVGEEVPSYWSVMAHNQQTADQAIQVYAVCLSGSGLTGALVRDESVSYKTETTSTSVTLSCPTGAVMAVGGYEGTGAFSSRVSDEGAGIWEVQVTGKIYLDGSLDHAVCLYLP
jgi:hypothetical protein